MTPQERELISDLFGRLAQLENQPRDPDAERAIDEGLRRAPHSTYALVQTVLVQDEALKTANAHIEALESGAAASEPAQPRGFLDNMRDALFGQSETRGGAVPLMWPRPQWEPPLRSAASQPASAQPSQGGYGQPASQGASFLGTAAATAAGMVGGALLLNGVRSMLGGYHQGGPFAKTFDELNAGPRFDDGSSLQGRGYDEGDAPEEAYDTGENDFADSGGFDDGFDGGPDSA
jgi:hypothetical protein